MKTKNPLPVMQRIWSERRDSNSRPRPWQGRALPTELLSRWGGKSIILDLIAKKYLNFFGAWVVMPDLFRHPIG